MRVLTNRWRRGPAHLEVIAGPTRLDRRTKRLVRRLRPGDIALIDHEDLDRVAADALVAARVAGVINAKPSITGRYPNLGPELLIEAGIPLVDSVGEDAFAQVREGDRLAIDGSTVRANGTTIAHGVRQDAQSVAQAMAAARANLSDQLAGFVANTLRYLTEERELLLDGVGVPEIETQIAGRHCLIVVRGYNYAADLDVLRPYIREFKPVLIGVDGGADALAEAGYTPDLIIGDMDSVSDDTLCCGAEVVVHSYPDGRAPGLARVSQLGVSAVTFAAAATSEDIAMLLADDKGAALIVAVGSHATLVEFLDKGRGGMASTFLTRLRVGGKLVDAKGVSRLYRQRTSAPALLALVASGLAALGAAVAVSTVGQAYLGVIAEWFNALLFDVQRLF